MAPQLRSTNRTYLRIPDLETLLRDHGIGMTQPQLTVHQDGSWFRVDEQQSVDLRTRARYRVLLQMLVREHLQDPSATISVAAVIREVWPDERLRHTVARNRAYVALCSLRKWGLEGLLLRTQQGYQLDPNLRVQVVDGPAADELPSAEARAHGEYAMPADYSALGDSRMLSEDRAVGAPALHDCASNQRTLAEEHASGVQREAHSTRVRLAEMSEHDGDRLILPRLVG